MRIQRLAVIGAFVFGLFMGATAVVSAQGSRSPLEIQRQEPSVTEGVAVRIVGRRGERVVGTLVAKVDGQWVEVQLAPQDSFVKSR